MESTQKEKEAATHRFYSTQKLFDQHRKGIINMAELEAKMIEVVLRTSAPQAGKSGWTHPEKDYDHWNREYSNGDQAEITKVYDDNIHTGERSLSHVVWMYCDSAGLAVAAGSCDILQQAKDRCDQENEVYN